jgi:large repetitive protein
MKKFLFLLAGMLSGCPVVGVPPVDADGDGFSVEVDCNDNDATIHPEQEEPCACDTIDQNCNGLTDDFLCDLFCADNDGDGFFTGVDCNDNDASIHPEQEEPCTCDNIDHNCNGSTTDLPCDIACNDNDGDGFDVTQDCNDLDSDINPGAGEPCVCDSVDENCNGDPQDFDCEIACGDADGDGFDSSIDCNDDDVLIHPDQAEPCTCDAIDQDCNGLIDDFPCDLACDYLQQGETCDVSVTSSACEPGLLCCYPCGIDGCLDACVQPASNAECPLFP